MKVWTFAAVSIAAILATSAVAQIPNPPPRPSTLPRAVQPPAPAPQPAAPQVAQPSPPAAPATGAPVAASTPAAQTPAAQNPATDMESGDGQPLQARCAAYRDAFETALTRFGKAGVSPEFIERSNAFVASNCAGERNVCPRSNEELRIANVIVMRAVGATGGTFMPFACPPSATK